MLEFLAVVLVAAFVVAWLERYWNTHDDWFATITGWFVAAPGFLIIIGVFVAISVAFALALAFLVGLT